MLKKKWLLSCWLVFLAVCSILPAIKRVSPVIAEQSPNSVFIDNHLKSESLDLSIDLSTRPNLHFDCLTAADGLSFSLVTSILQDQRGFMWFGTRYGLDQYDGNSFTVYLPTTDGDVLQGNYIYDLYQDHSGDLWLSTYADVVRLDMKTGKFFHYKTNSGDHNSLTPGRAYTFGEDSTGTVWVGTLGGLNRYNPLTDTFSHYFEDVAVFRFYPDSSGGIWLGTSDGLWYISSGSLDQQDPIIYRNNPDDPNSLSSNIVSAIHEDEKGAVWVGTAGGGLDRLDLITGQFTHFTHNPDDPNSLSDNSVYSIIQDSSGRLWFGTQNGLNLFDESSGRFFQYHTYPDDLNSLKDDVIDRVFQDKAGVIWVATMAGICKLNEIASHFTFYQEGSNPMTGKIPDQSDLKTESVQSWSPGLSDSLITSIYEDNNNTLWVGTSQGGLNRLNRATGQITVFQHDSADSTSIGQGEVTAIYQDKAGTLWIGTQDGLDRFNPQTETFESETSVHGRLVGSIIEDQQGNLWLGTWTGLMRRRPGEANFNLIRLGSGLVEKQTIQSLFIDHIGALWIITQNAGFFRLDPEIKNGSTPSIIYFPEDFENSQNPESINALSIYEDHNGTLWLGSVDDGLLRFNPNTQKFDHFIPDTGTAKYVNCVQEDADGYLWMGTALGLARFDPRSEIFSYFDARDGLKIGEGTDCFQNKKGEMFFGSISGLATFFPNQIIDNPNPPAVVITALNLNNKPLRTNLLSDEKIRLSFQENYLSFDFSALDFTNPAKNLYAYKMEGMDEVWTESGTRRHADYPDLKPGTYTFRVKASNNSGIWNEQGTAVKITITPPFWQTWWFIGLMGLMLAGFVVVGVRLRVKAIETRSLELEDQVRNRTAELEASVAQLTALQDTTKAMASTLELDKLLNLIVQQATTLLHADGGIINLVDEDNREDEIVAITGLIPPSVGLRTPLDASLSGWVTLHNQPIISNQIPSDNRIARSTLSWVRDHNIQSAAAAPLTVRDQVKGSLIVVGQKEGKREFVKSDLDLLVAFANQAAIAIENASLYSQSKELAVHEERSRLARELHDAVTQTLFSASLVAEALPASWEKDPDEGRGLLQELRGLCRGALAEMRSLLLELRPAALMETHIGDLLRQLGEAASGRAGIPIHVQVDKQVKLPPDVQIAFYRITQETLNNVVKHARAHQVNVDLCYTSTGTDSNPIPRKVILMISDDGRGFDPSQIPHNRLGLGIMQERAQAVGASLAIDSQPGHGTKVTILWDELETEEEK